MKSAIHSIALALICMMAGTVSVADNSTSTTQTGTAPPSRQDALAQGDRVILNVDAPIFRKLPTSASDAPQVSVCVPRRSQFEIWKAPTVRTTTKASTPDGTSAPSVTTSSGNGSTTSTVKSTAADQTISTTAESLATARIIRIGKAFGFQKQATKDCQDVPTGFTTAVKNEEYEFAPADLDKYSNSRYGFTYGGLVVPNKIEIVDRSFYQSTSVMPYVGYKGWSSWGSLSGVLAAGVGTAPASASTSSSNNSSSTKSIFSVASGGIWNIAGVFQFGVLIGVDTAGSHNNYKYQGKPWIGVTLGAGK